MATKMRKNVVSLFRSLSGYDGELYRIIGLLHCVLQLQALRPVARPYPHNRFEASAAPSDNAFSFAQPISG